MVIVFRPVGAAEHKTILGAVRVESPLQDNAGRSNTFSIVGRIHGKSRSRARQVGDVDFDFVVGIRRRGDQIVGARQHVQVLDDRASAEVSKLRWSLGIDRSRRSRRSRRRRRGGHREAEAAGLTRVGEQHSGSARGGVHLHEVVVA